MDIAAATRRTANSSSGISNHGNAIVSSHFPARFQNFLSRVRLTDHFDMPGSVACFLTLAKSTSTKCGPAVPDLASANKSESPVL